MKKCRYYADINLYIWKKVMFYTYQQMSLLMLGWCKSHFHKCSIKQGFSESAVIVLQIEKYFECYLHGKFFTVAIIRVFVDVLLRTDYIRSWLWAEFMMPLMPLRNTNLVENFFSLLRNKMELSAMCSAGIFNLVLFIC